MHIAARPCVPEVGIYCLNAASLLTGMEPTEATGYIFELTRDSCFREVEATCSFSMKFPSVLISTCVTGYAAHRLQFSA